MNLYLAVVFMSSHMSSKIDSYQKRRLQSSYFSVVISISLVLFMVGVLGLILLKSKQVANYFKNEVVITMFLKNDITSKQIEDLRTYLLEKSYSRDLIFISKEEAAEFYSKDLGEDFVTYLGTNPLKNSIDIYLNPDFVTPEKMLEISNQLKKNTFSFEVSYDKPLVTFLTKNIQKMSFWLFVVSTFFGLIAIVLINSSIRLSVYSRRFNIKTMQMVGATKSFIRRPFIWNGIRLGFLGALIAMIGLAFVVYYINQKIPSLQLLSDYATHAYLGMGLLTISFLITWLSSFLATNRFLNLQTDELYY